MKLRHSLIGAVVALGLSLTAQAASAGSLGPDAPALKEQAQGTFTLIKGGHHWHRGGRFWGADSMQRRSTPRAPVRKAAAAAR